MMCVEPEAGAAVGWRCASSRLHLDVDIIGLGEPAGEDVRLQVALLVGRRHADGARAIGVLLHLPEWQQCGSAPVTLSCCSDLQHTRRLPMQGSCPKYDHVQDHVQTVSKA